MRRALHTRVRLCSVCVRVRVCLCVACAVGMLRAAKTHGEFCLFFLKTFFPNWRREIAFFRTSREESWPPSPMKSPMKRPSTRISLALLACLTFVLPPAAGRRATRTHDEQRTVMGVRLRRRASVASSVASTAASTLGTPPIDTDNMCFCTNRVFDHESKETWRKALGFDLLLQETEHDQSDYYKLYQLWFASYPDLSPCDLNKHVREAYQMQDKADKDAK